jgi:hypothetical protein
MPSATAPSKASAHAAKRNGISTKTRQNMATSPATGPSKTIEAKAFVWQHILQLDGHLNKEGQSSKESKAVCTIKLIVPDGEGDLSPLGST